MKITKENYATYKAAFGILSEHLLFGFAAAMDPALSPMAMLATWEQKSMSIARRSLAAGLRDYLVMLMHLSTEERQFINEKLRNKNLPGLPELMQLVNDVPAHVLKRGMIKSLDEYYTIKELVDSGSVRGYETHKNRLMAMLGDFERISATKINAKK